MSAPRALPPTGGDRPAGREGRAHGGGESGKAPRTAPRLATGDPEQTPRRVRHWITEVSEVSTEGDAWRLVDRFGYEPPVPGQATLAQVVAERLAVLTPPLIDALWDHVTARDHLLANPALPAAERTRLRERLVEMARWGDTGADAALKILAADLARAEAPLEPSVRAQLLDLALRSVARHRVGSVAAGVALRVPDLAAEEVEALAGEYASQTTVQRLVLAHPHCSVAVARRYAASLSEAVCERPEVFRVVKAGVLEGLSARPDLLADPEVRANVAVAAAVTPALARAFCWTATDPADRWAWFEVWATLDEQPALAWAQLALEAGIPVPGEALTPLFCAQDPQVREASVALLALASHCPATAAELPTRQEPLPTLEALLDRREARAQASTAPTGAAPGTTSAIARLHARLLETLDEDDRPAGSPPRARRPNR